MEINSVSAVYPVIKIKSNKKDQTTDDKRKNEEKSDRNFEKTILNKKKEGGAVDAKV